MKRGQHGDEEDQRLGIAELGDQPWRNSAPGRPSAAATSAPPRLRSMRSAVQARYAIAPHRRNGIDLGPRRQRRPDTQRESRKYIAFPAVDAEVAEKDCAARRAAALSDHGEDRRTGA
jgi:hypothetical protein